MRKAVIAAIVFAVSGFNIQSGIAGVSTSKIFKKKCAMCHALNKNKFGPAFSQMNKDATVLRTTIKNGRKSMPSFEKKLSAEDIDAMVSFIQSNQVE